MSSKFKLVNEEFMNILFEYWESILAEEGLEEISLFDNTGKKAVTFVSQTIAMESEDGFDDCWQEQRNFQLHGEQFTLADTDSAEYWRMISIQVASLPPGWPEIDRALLDEYAETGNFDKSWRSLGISKNDAYSAKRRFKTWIRNTIGY